MTDTGTKATVIPQTMVAKNSYIPAAGTFLAGHSYSWRVRAITASGTVGDQSVAVPFTFPAANTPTILVSGSVGSTTPTISWTPVPGASSYSVFLEDFHEYEQNGGVGSPTVDYSDQFHATTSLVITSPLIYPDYLLSVYANFTSGNTTTTGPQGSAYFFVKTVGTTTQLYPTDGSPVPTSEPVLRWTPAAGASSYDVTITDVTNPQSNPNPITAVVAGLACQYVPSPELTKGDAYTWTVTPVNASGNLGEFNPGALVHGRQQCRDPRQPGLADLELAQQRDDHPHRPHVQLVVRAGSDRLSPVCRHGIGYRHHDRQPGL